MQIAHYLNAEFVIVIVASTGMRDRVGSILYICQGIGVVGLERRIAIYIIILHSPALPERINKEVREREQ